MKTFKQAVRAVREAYETNQSPEAEAIKWQREHGFDMYRVMETARMPPPSVNSDDMPDPNALVIYHDGVVGAAMFHYAADELTTEDMRRIARDKGFAIQFISMEDDLGDDDHPLMVAHFKNGASDTCTKWNPEPPEGWKLGGKHDTEDGPYAYFLKRCRS